MMGVVRFNSQRGLFVPQNPMHTSTPGITVFIQAMMLSKSKQLWSKASRKMDESIVVKHTLLEVPKARPFCKRTVPQTSASLSRRKLQLGQRINLQGFFVVNITGPISFFSMDDIF